MYALHIRSDRALQIAAHWKREHGLVPKVGPLARTCQAQRWNSSSTYFQVGAAPNAAQSCVSAAQEPQQQQQKNQPEPQSQSRPEPLQKRQVATDANDVLEDRPCRFAFLLQDDNLREHALLVELGQSLRKRLARARLLEMHQVGSERLPSVPLVARNRLARLDGKSDASLIDASHQRVK